MAPADFQTISVLVAEAAARRRFQTLLLAVFAAIGLSLALVGIYGLVAYSAKERTRETGIRMAIGATRFQVMRAFLREGAWLSGAGILAGLCISFALRRVIAGWLYGVGPADPVTFAVVPVLIFGTSLIACVIPAWRASGVPPMTALRQE